MPGFLCVNGLRARPFGAACLHFFDGSGVIVTYMLSGVRAPAGRIITRSGPAGGRQYRPGSLRRREIRTAKFQIGSIVRHRVYPFRGVIFDVDPTFSNTEEWWESIPEEVRPVKDQPFYHLLAENEETTYTAYVSEQNLLPDDENGPVGHPDIEEVFTGLEGGRYVLRDMVAN